MAVYYALEPIGCPESNPSGDSRCTLVPIDHAKAKEAKGAVVAVVSPEQFDNLELLSDISNDFLHSLVKAESNFVDVYADHVIGSFAVPNKNNLLSHLSAFAFYANDKRLIFADSTGEAEATLQMIVDSGVMSDSTIAHCLYVFIKQLLVDEIEYMADIQVQMEKLEEDMLERNKDVDTITIMQYRRQSMRLAAYYEQVGTMADILADNESKLYTNKEGRAFANISAFADRLAARGESLENYSLQLHELHQTRIDLKQNTIMQVLTVVTVIIAPLTLMTGWFGMNVGLPGSDYPFMWLILVAVGLGVSLLLILHFRRKNWL